MKLNRIPIALLGLMLTACNADSPAEEAPELIAPKVNLSSYSPAVKGVLEKTTAVLATVKAKEYGQHFKKNVTVGEICVALGDEVKAGDVIAVKNTEELKLKLKKYNQLLEDENRAYELRESIANERIAQLMLLGGAENKTAILTEQEELRYEQTLHEDRVLELNREIELINADITDDKLYANVSGTVTYIKSIAAEQTAAPTDNIVVITDMKDTYLEPDILMSAYSNLKKKYDQYIIYNGERRPVIELPYTSDELTLARYYGSSAKVRLDCDVDDMKVGDNYYVYFTNPEKRENVLVYASSIYGDGNYYVYVSNNGSNEKRFVEIGESDGWYTEIISGVEENEMVEFSADTLIPSANEITVISEDITIMNHTDSWYIADFGDSIITADVSGTIIEISELFASKKFPIAVNKGDYLYTVDLGVTEAQIKEKELNLSRAEQRYHKTEKSFDEQINENNKIIKAASDAATREYYQHELNILSYEKQNALTDIQTEIDEAKAEYNSIRGDEETPGFKKYYATRTGVIKEVYVKEGNFINGWDSIYAIASQSGQIRIAMDNLSGSGIYSDDSNVADIGEQIEIKAKKFGDATYKGKCVGYYGSRLNSDMPYFDYEDKELHISFNSDAGYNAPGFFVELDEECKELLGKNTSELRASFPAARLSAAIVIPIKSIQDLKGANPYVWVKKDGYVYKQKIKIEDKYSQEIGGALVVAGLSGGEVIVY